MTPAPTPRTRRWRRLSAIVLLDVVALAVFAAVFLSSPYEITRVRNSLIASVGQPGDFAWRPGEAPSDFRQEALEPPGEFLEAAAAVRSAEGDRSDFDIAVAIARHMTRGSHGGGLISSNTLDAYRRIAGENRGQCSDYTQVFHGLARAAGLFSREWAMSFDGFGGHGHAFSEVFDRDLGKWAFLDTYNSFYVTDRDSGVPLSALELREAFAADRTTSVVVVAIDPPAFGFRDEDALFDYYRRGMDEYFLWFGNDVFSYDAHPAVKLLGPHSRAAEQAAAIVLGVHPRFKIYETATNRTTVRRFLARRVLFLAGVVVLGALAVWTVVEVTRAWRSRRTPATSRS